MLIQELTSLGLNEKEAKVYLALLEYGMQPASVIARKTEFPKTTVLFLFNNLFRKGYIRKSHKGRTQYFYADIDDFHKAKTNEFKTKQDILEKAIPVLQEFKNPFSSPPKITFYEGLDGCRKAYWSMLDEKADIYEFSSHLDLVRMGKDFIQKFIHERVRRGIFLTCICKRNPTHEYFQRIDKKENRKVGMYDKTDVNGELYSSINAFGDKTLLLSLYSDPFAIIIQNKQIAEAFKTIYQLVWRGLRK